MKKKDILWILIFALLFGSPFVSWFFLKNSVDTQNYENREVTEMPKISLEEYAQFPQQYETYFNDNIPWRNQLISLNSGLDLFAFRDSSNENVLIGKDGWLFFTGGTNPVEQSTGQRLLSEDDLEKIAGQLTLVQRWVQSRGEKFIFFLAPHKETIYRDKLPESETVVTDETEAFQLINYLKEHTDISVVWPYEELMEAKADSGMWIYSKLDTHWGNPGAYIGAKALAEELEVEMPELSEVSAELSEISRGDLANMLNVSIPNGDREYQLSGYEVEDGNQGESYMEFHQNSGSSLKLAIRRDSFGARLSKVLQHAFQDVYVAQGETDLIDVDADVFVYELVERSLENPDLGLPYLSVSSNTDENGKAVTLKAECDLNGFYISAFRQPDGTDDWQGVLIGETISQEGTTFAVPDGENGRLQIYMFLDANGEKPVHEMTLEY